MVKGLHPLGTEDLKIEQFSVPVTNGTVFYRKCAAIATSGGVAAVWSSSGDNANYIGPVMGIYDSNKVELNYLPVSTAGYVDVATNKELKLKVQADGAISETDRFNVADLASNSGTASTGNSTAVLSASTGTGCSLFTVIGRIETPGNAWDNTTAPEFVVTAYKHKLNKAAGSGGL